MTWVLDILSILLIVGLCAYGIKVGFFRSVVDFALVVVCLGGAGFLAYISVLKLFDSWGWVADLALFWRNLLGDSKINGGQEIIDTVCYWLSFGLLTLTTFIVYYAILNLIRKLIMRISGAVNKKVGIIRFFDSLLGFIVMAAISLGIVFGLMAFVHAFDGAMFTNMHEAYVASEILSLLYDVNPLNSVIEDLGIAEMLLESLSAFLQI